MRETEAGPDGPQNSGDEKGAGHRWGRRPPFVVVGAGQPLYTTLGNYKMFVESRLLVLALCFCAVSCTTGPRGQYLRIPLFWPVPCLWFRCGTPTSVEQVMFITIPPGHIDGLLRDFFRLSRSLFSRKKLCLFDANICSHFWVNVT